MSRRAQEHPKQSRQQPAASLTADLNADLKNAIALHQRGQLGDAEPIYRKILQAAPKHFDGLHLLGVLKHQQSRNDEAVKLIAAALQQRPNEAVALANYGAVLNALKRFAETVASCDRAIALKPDHPESFNNRGVALKELGHSEEALASYDRAIALRPTYAEAFNNRGIALRELKRTAEALASYDRAIELKPVYAEAYNNRGVALAELKRFNEALINYAKAITLRRNYAEAYNNSGAALYLLKRHDEARACYDQAIACDENHADAHWNKAQLTLLQGDFIHGWTEYEWRWKIGAAARITQDFLKPQWQGDGTIAGKTILLHSEQGLGDTIQFCRYVPLVAERGAQVILEVQSPLKRLTANLSGVTQVIAKGEPRPAYDFHCPLLSLPLAFGTRLDTIPPSRLHAPTEGLIGWTELSDAGNRPRIGLAWSGNASHKRDADRSITLRAMLPLLDIDATFVSLQKDVRTSDDTLLKERNDILDVRDRLGDFSDTAALVAQLDLVISVDTSVAHLAGALGKPVWLLLNDVPDWRWLLDRDDSPWYPTARLFRQDATCDWDWVIARVHGTLQEFATARR
jgi:tetratricopeptide (TPR) repeat protein